MSKMFPIKQKHLQKLLLSISLILQVATCIDDEEASPRIIGGNKTPIGAYPWFARSTIYNSDNWAGCGGSLVSPSFVLTAAHCINSDFLQSGGYVIGSRCYGDGDLNNNNCGQSPSEYRTVDAYWIDPEYGSNEQMGLDYDYALIRLNEPVTNIDPVLMNEESDIPKKGQDVIAMGFGYTTNQGNGNPSKNLLEVTLDIISNKDCKKKWGNEGITDRMICAVGGNTKDSCSGDSGGPLITKTDSDPIKLVGISSFGGNDCADPNFPGVSVFHVCTTFCFTSFFFFISYIFSISIF